MTLQASTPSGQTYEALIPGVPKATLQIFSRKLTLAEGGQVLPSRVTTREIAPRPGNAPVMTLSVTGRIN